MNLKNFGERGGGRELIGSKSKNSDIKIIRHSFIKRKKGNIKI
jgi:hypothetical protein